MVTQPAINDRVPASTVAAAASGDALALSRIVAAYHADLVRLAYVVTGDAELAQDAAQSAWAIAWRKLGSLSDPARLRQWLFTVAANEARQALRRRRRSPVHPIEVVEIGSSAGDPARRVATIDLERALRGLTPEERLLIGMRHLGGFDSREIGEALGISPEAVRTRLTRLVARLRTELGDD
ncbi:MAG TPA: sigma-70 family RNA polymerase sigma factor [Candidatus Binatia bacterium]|nr:sigma-70 family RNA polymerase sigma factor [Candidatus Binatia bacterium]